MKAQKLKEGNLQFLQYARDFLREAKDIKRRYGLSKNTPIILYAGGWFQFKDAYKGKKYEDAVVANFLEKRGLLKITTDTYSMAKFILIK